MNKCYKCMPWVGDLGPVEKNKPPPPPPPIIEPPPPPFLEVYFIADDGVVSVELNGVSQPWIRDVSTGTRFSAGFYKIADGMKVGKNVLDVTWHNNIGFNTYAGMGFDGIVPAGYSVIGLYNTGLDDNKRFLPFGAEDKHWTLTQYNGEPRLEPMKVIREKDAIHDFKDVDGQDLKLQFLGWTGGGQPSDGNYAMRTEFIIDKL